MSLPKKSISPVQEPELLKSLLETRTIIISSEVNQKLAEKVIQQLLLLEQHAKTKTVYLLINSPGGEIQSGFAIFDMLKFISCPVVTLALGMAASMGSVLLLAANKGMRYALPHTKIMLHQPSMGHVQGFAQDLEIHATEIEKTKQLLSKMYAKETGQKVSKILTDLERDHWLNATEAKKYGLIDHIITSRKDLKSPK